jgi:hypothetical protein
MRRILPVLVTFLLLVNPAQIFAKGDTVKITIKGADLKTPIEITNPKILAEFPVWTGPGTGSSDPGFDSNVPGFIIDWSQGAIEEPPKGLQRYEVSFWAKLPKERLICEGRVPLEKIGAFSTHPFQLGVKDFARVAQLHFSSGTFSIQRSAPTACPCQYTSLGS